jgi:uncharacterized protein (TIGR00251 family)
MLNLEPHPGGVALAVNAHPGARRNAVRLQADGRLKVEVSQSPDKGKANKALIELLARRLGLKKSQIQLLSGETARQKRLLICGIDPRELAEKIEGLGTRDEGRGMKDEG